MTNNAQLPAGHGMPLDAESLLAGVLQELRAIKEQLAKQQPPNSDSSSNWGCVNCEKPKQQQQASTESQLTREARIGPVLQEALQRYRLNAVPQWSAFYGAHLSSGPEHNLGHDEALSSAWKSVVGECWQIPHDNRVSLCFLSAPTDPTSLVRVRNFLYHFHDAHPLELPRGKYINVWDWFDTAVSTHWHPHKTAADLEADAKKRARAENALPKPSAPPSSLLISPMVAPWRRLINLNGLTSIRNGETEEKRARITDEDICPFFLPKNKDDIFELPVNDIVWRAVKKHLRCQRTGETSYAELATKGCLLFHITFYEMLDAKYEVNLTELWPCGELYGDGKGLRGRRVRESALTIIAVPNGEISNCKPTRTIFWTIICLRPLGFPQPHYFERRDDLSQGNFHDMIDDMSDIVHMCLVDLLGRWEEMAEYFEDIFCEKRAVLDPAFHDTLLTDDVTLSRSKKYFWAIEFLKELEKSVVDNIRQVDRFLGLLRDNPPPHSRNPRDFDSRIRKQYACLTKLEILRARFAQKREEAMALRDGVSLLESRRHVSLLIPTAVQCQRCHGEPHIDKTRREHQVADFCQHLLPPFVLLHRESFLFLGL
jgi:hypothetical protein